MVGFLSTLIGWVNLASQSERTTNPLLAIHSSYYSLVTTSGGNARKHGTQEYEPLDINYTVTNDAFENVHGAL